MSDDIRIYESDDGKQTMVTAFYGGSKNKSSVQFSVGNEYFVLSESQTIDLMATLARRLNGKSYPTLMRVLPDGSEVSAEDDGR